jgi:hypothetical protein
MRDSIGQGKEPLATMSNVTLWVVLDFEGLEQVRRAEAGVQRREPRCESLAVRFYGWLSMTISWVGSERSR